MARRVPPHPRRLSVGSCATLACLAELSAPKAGNVHFKAAFDDVTWVHFAVSGAAIASTIERAADLGLGPCVLSCVRATRSAVGTNTNLGIVLLLAPLAVAASGVSRAPSIKSLRRGVADVLRGATLGDAKLIYQAIREAKPGGLGRAKKGDVRGGGPTLPLLEAMSLAADRDAIARQYVNGFADVFEHVLPAIERACRVHGSLDTAVVAAQLTCMAAEPDGLIRRKCGDAVAVQSSKRAAAVLASGWPGGGSRGTNALRSFDRWLRADGRRRNPGTTADLLVAALFVGFLCDRLPVPWAP